MLLACKSCPGCELNAQLELTNRAYLEHQYWGPNTPACMVNATYAPGHLPAYGSIRRRDLLLLLDALESQKRRLGTANRLVMPDGSRQTLRFLGCYEYGDNTGRSHMHLGLIGEDFLSDRVFSHKSRGSGQNLYTSKRLSQLLRYGECYLGDLGPGALAYIASYMHKATGIESAANSSVPLGKYSDIDPQLDALENSGRVVFDQAALKHTGFAQKQRRARERSAEAVRTKAAERHTRLELERRENDFFQDRDATDPELRKLFELLEHQTTPKEVSERKARQRDYVERAVATYSPVAYLRGRQQRHQSADLGKPWLESLDGQNHFGIEIVRHESNPKIDSWEAKSPIYSGRGTFLYDGREARVPKYLLGQVRMHLIPIALRESEHPGSEWSIHRELLGAVAEEGRSPLPLDSEQAQINILLAIDIRDQIEQLREADWNADEDARKRGVRIQRHEQTLRDPDARKRTGSYEPGDHPLSRQERFLKARAAEQLSRKGGAILERRRQEIIGEEGVYEQILDLEQSAGRISKEERAGFEVLRETRLWLRFTAARSKLRKQRARSLPKPEHPPEARSLGTEAPG